MTDEQSLSKVLTGESVAFESGRVTFVRKWGAKAVLHEVPAIFGRLFSRLAPLGRQGSLSDEAQIPVLLELAAGDVSKLLALSCDLKVEEIEELDADDLVRLVRAVIRQNASFFTESLGLYKDLRDQGLVGRELQLHSSKPGSDLVS